MAQEDSPTPPGSYVGRISIQIDKRLIHLSYTHRAIITALKASVFDCVCEWLFIIPQLSYKQKTDEQRLFSLCLERAHETEFFIRKAIGWSLRQYSWTNKKAVKDFVEKNRDSFAPLSVREALKHC